MYQLFSKLGKYFMTFPTYKKSIYFVPPVDTFQYQKQSDGALYKEMKKEAQLQTFRSHTTNGSSCMMLNCKSDTVAPGIITLVSTR